MASIEISRRPEDVFEFALDPLNYPDWDDSVISAHREGSAPLAVGSKTTVLYRVGPMKVPTIEEVMELDPPRHFTNRGVTGPLAGVSRFTVEPLDGGQRSRLTMTLDIEASGLAKLLIPLGRARARRSLPKQLKDMQAVLNGGATADGQR